MNTDSKWHFLDAAATAFLGTVPRGEYDDAALARRAYRFAATMLAERESRRTSAGDDAGHGDLYRDMERRRAQGSPKDVDARAGYDEHGAPLRSYDEAPTYESIVALRRRALNVGLDPEAPLERIVGEEKLRGIKHDG